MGKQVNIGIVGFGKMGILHAGILNSLPECGVIAVCETETLVRKIASKALPNMKFYGDLSDMVAREDLDAVYITTPIASHASALTILAHSTKRLGVFVEKPLARNGIEAHQIARMASEFSTVTMVGFQKRFLPQFVRARELINQGVLGRVQSFKGYSYFSSVLSEKHGWRFRKGEGGALLDMGPHLIDLVIWFFGRPTSVKGRLTSIYSKEVEDYARIDFEFGLEIKGTVEISWSEEGYRLPETGIQVSGSNGTLKVDDYSLDLSITESVPGVIESGRKAFLRPQLTQGVRFLLGDPEYCLEDEHFVQCIRKGICAAPSFQDGLEVDEVIEASRASAITNL